MQNSHILFLLWPCHFVIRQAKEKGYDNIRLNSNFELLTVQAYMDYVYFPHGIDPVTIKVDFHDFLSAYNGKSYIPITCFSCR